MFDVTKIGFEAMLSALTDLDCIVTVIQPEKIMIVQTELTNDVAVFHVEQMNNKIIEAMNEAIANCKYDLSSINDMFLKVQFVIL